MKMLVVFPSYTPSSEELLYRATTVVPIKKNKDENPMGEYSFRSTSIMLGPAKNSPQNGIDWSDDGDEIITVVPGEGDYSLGEALPIGDVMLPMVLMSFCYLAYKRVSALLRSGSQKG